MIQRAGAVSSPRYEVPVASFPYPNSLKQHAVRLGIASDKIAVVGNGVDTTRFHRVSRPSARESLGLPADAPVLISVGALVERKGFHRVMECLPALRRQFPALCYLVAGGPSPEGDWSTELRALVDRLGLKDCVRFLGAIAPDHLSIALSAADVFVLATRNEGWANVFLEAMACGLPVVTTDVGGNAEVVSDPSLGTLVPFGDGDALAQAISSALRRDWDRDAIVAYAGANSWDRRVETLAQAFSSLVAGDSAVNVSGRAVQHS